VPSAAYISVQDVTSGAGGLAAAIAIGAFIGQAFNSFSPSSDRKRRRDTATGGLAGFVVMSGLILLSANGW
jgi:hypothetical protein